MNFQQSNSHPISSKNSLSKPSLNPKTSGNIGDNLNAGNTNNDRIKKPEFNNLMNKISFENKKRDSGSGGAALPLIVN
jgi:hypothetical protein